jgi:hypothetical protein
MKVKSCCILLAVRYETMVRTRLNVADSHFPPGIDEVDRNKGPMISLVREDRFQRTPAECKAACNLVLPRKGRWGKSVPCIWNSA